MKKKYFTIQIIPEDSHEIKKIKVSTLWFTLIKVFLVIFIAVAIIFAYHLGKINKIILDYGKMQMINAQLIKKDNNYEEMFSRLDSLWILENRIQNIFETFLENDSNKINSIIDKNRFAHTPSEKNEVDFDGANRWIPLEEKIKKERIPSIIPVVGIVSKKFSEDENHLGVDFSASQGSSIFATGNGQVEFAGENGELGKMIIIDHLNGYKTSYSHLKQIKVKKGKNVNKGDIIGNVGNTGNTTGSHLHYEITKNGVAEDPETYFNF